MKTCEEYILKQYLEQDKVIKEKEEKIKELESQVVALKNPVSEFLADEEKIDCITLYKSVNVIYQLNINMNLYEYKEAFTSLYTNGKITLDEMKKSLENDEELEKINNCISLSRYSFKERMYKFEPATHDMFEFNINDVQYVIWGNYENMVLSRLNDFDIKDGLYYEKYKEECLEKARAEVRKILKSTIKYLEKCEMENAT